MALVQSTHNNIVSFVESAAGTAGGTVNLPTPPGTPGNTGPSTIRILSINVGAKVVTVGDVFEARLHDGTNILWRGLLDNTVAAQTVSKLFDFTRDNAPRLSGATPQFRIALLSGSGTLTCYSGSITFEFV